MTVQTLSKPSANSVLERIATDLDGKKLIATPQSQNCDVAFVVPAYGETPARVNKLLCSLQSQGIGDKQEVIVVVNNAPSNGTAKWREAYELNQHLLHDFTPPGGLTVHMIDQSSPGLWVPGNNVGMARQRGLLETARRFAMRGHNGIIVHTDVDCWYEDATFSERVVWLFDNQPDLVGVVGDYSFELEIDDPEAPQGVPDLVRQYKLLRRYDELYRHIVAGEVRRSPLKALGRCIIHRAFEGIAVGGIQPINLGEDVAFGKALEHYATENELRFEHGRQWSLGPVAALRVSTRTGNDSLSRSLAKAHPKGDDPVVNDAFNPGAQVVLDEAYMQRLVAAVRDMPGGAGVIEWLFITSALARLPN